MTGQLSNPGVAVIEVDAGTGHSKNLTPDGSDVEWAKSDPEGGVGCNDAANGTITNSTIRGFSGAAVRASGGAST